MQQAAAAAAHPLVALQHLAARLRAALVIPVAVVAVRGGGGLRILQKGGCLGGGGRRGGLGGLGRLRLLLLFLGIVLLGTGRLHEARPAAPALARPHCCPAAY